MRELCTLRHSFVEQVPQVQGNLAGVYRMHVGTKEIKDGELYGTRTESMPKMQMRTEHNDVRNTEGLS